MLFISRDSKIEQENYFGKQQVGSISIHCLTVSIIRLYTLCWVGML